MQFPARLKSIVLAAAAVCAAHLPASAQNADPIPDLLEQIGATISVGPVEAVGANMSGDAIADALRGNLAAHADELAHLDADLIRIPDMTLSFALNPEVADLSLSVAYRDLELRNVRGGRAERVSISGATTRGPESSVSENKAIVMHNYDLNALLGFYLGTADGDRSYRTLFDSMDDGGYDSVSDEATCHSGASHIGAVSVRPMATPMKDLLGGIADYVAKASTRMDAELSPETQAMLLAALPDLFTAFKSEPGRSGGVQCTLQTPEVGKIDFELGNVTYGAYADMRYPDISVDGITISSAPFSVSLDGATLKSIDFSNTLDEIAGAGAGIGDAWFEENARKLIPEVGGLSLTGGSFEVREPEGENPGTLLSATLGSYDLTLDNYRNGIPTRIASSMHDFAFTPPQDMSDATLEVLRQQGVDTLHVGYDLAVNWNADTHMLSIDKLHVESGDLGGITLTALLGNALEDLFSDDPVQMGIAASGLTFKTLSADVDNRGIVDLLVALAAAQEGQDAETVRASASGMAQGMILMTLSANPNAADLAAAVSGLLREGKSMSATISARTESGLGLAEIAALESNPTALGTMLDISSSAE